MQKVAAFSFALVLILSGCSESSSGDGGAGGTAGSGGSAGASGMGGTSPPPPAVDQTCRDICANEAEGFSCFQGPPDLVQACYEQCLRDYQAYVPCGDEWIAIYDCLLDLECADLFGDCDSTQDQLDECVRLENNRIYCEAECPQLDIAQCQQDITECLQFAQANRFCVANCAIQDRQECIAQYISTGQCGSGGAGGMGGEGGTGGGSPAMERTSHTLTCTIDTLVLEIPIELTYSVDRPFVAGAAEDLTFSAAVIFDEVFSAALIDAGVSKVDIKSIGITSWVLGATPSMLETSLSAGINDFDLDLDTDDNGAPGPHRLELETVATTASVDEDAIEVELGLGLDGVSLLLGDFSVPTDCIDPTLVGLPASFEVGLESRIFRTDANQNANLGGIAGADAICAAQALAAGLEGEFKAWLSTIASPVADRITQPSGPYVLVDGTRVADNWNDLVDGSILAPINLDANGVFRSGEVWTGTLANGASYAISDCEGFTNGSGGIALCGASSATNATWTENITPACSTALGLYCVEQPIQ